MLREIPTVDFGMENAELVETLGSAFREIGFVFVRKPEVSKMLPRAYREFAEVFGLPPEAKRRYLRPDLFHQRGWTPPYTEKAIACRRRGVGGTDLPDAKEGWFIGPELPDGHYLVEQFPKLYPKNIWPEEVPGFAPVARELYTALYKLGTELLSVLGVYLEQPMGYFEEMARDSPTVMRAIHYPAIIEEEVGKIVWACQHTDINFITLLPASTRNGLWIKRRNGEWISGMAPEGCVIAQVGDMLSYLTRGHFISAVHEVRAPEHPTSEGRFSAALFVHARSDVVLDPSTLKGKFLGSRRIRKPVTAGEFLEKRLRAIGLGH